MLYIVSTLLAAVLALASACGQPPPPEPVDVFLVALEGAGAQGPTVGCGDVLVAVERPAPAAGSRLEAALRALVQAPDSSGLVNRVGSLSVERVEQAPARTSIYLTGRLALGGVCDNPRVEAQLRRTAQAASDADSIAFYLNGEPLSSVLSLRGS